MPKVSIKGNKGTIIFDEQDWLAGLNTNTADSEVSKLTGNVAMSGISVLRQFGFVTPNPLQRDVTNVAQITAFLRNSVNVGDNAYIIASNSLVHKLTTLASGTISTTAPFPHTIDHAHTNEAGNDIALYYNQAGQQCAFYSFSDDTDWDVGIYNIPGDTFDDDFMSTIPVSPLAAPYLTGGKGYPHPLIVGDDDILYIGDRNFVHAFDRTVGATGTFYPAVLTLPKGYVITCFTTTQDINLAIGTYLSASDSGTSDVFYRGTAKVWFWNYLALDPDYSRDLRDNYVSELIQWGGTTAAFTSGRKTLSDKGVYKLQALNGSQFEVIKTWNGGGLPIRGGVDNVNNDLYWNSASYIYAFTKRPDNGQYMLNIVSQTQSGTSGLLKFLTASSIIHYSWGAGALNGGLMYLNDNYSPDAVLRTQNVTPEFDVRQRGRIMSITVGFGGTFSGGRSFELVTYLDGTSAFTTGEVASITATRVVRFTTNSDGTPLGDFNYLQCQVGFPSGSAATSAPRVSWVRYDFDIVNVNASN